MIVVPGLRVTRAPDGRTLEVADAGGAPLASLAFAIPGDDVPGWESDDEELVLAEADGVSSRLRASAGAGVLVAQLTVDNEGDQPVELPYLGLGVTLAEHRTGWSWTSDVEGIVTVMPLDGGGGGLLVRLRQGFLRAARELPVFVDVTSDRGAFHLSPPGALLGGHRRHAVTLELSALASLQEARDRLPAWLPSLVVRAGTQIDLHLPDRAVLPGPGVECSLVDTDVVVTGEPGHREVAIHGREVERLGIAFHPSVADLLPDLVRLLTRRRAARSTDAAGFLVAEAVARGLAPDPDRALDWLDQVDWLDRDSLLADAVAGVVASVQGERLQLDAAWRLLAARPATAGFGLVVMRLWLASLSATGEAPPLAAELLSREASDREARLELALLGRRSPEALDRPLSALVRLLGGPLPGHPIGLSASRAAIAVSLLKLCPEGWPRRREAAEAAGKAEGLLLADFADLPDQEGCLHSELDGLAWLLLGDLGI